MSEELENKTQLKENSVEQKDLLPSLQSTKLLLSLREEGAQLCFIHTHGQTWVFSPSSHGPQHHTAAQYRHFGCYTPRHYYVVSRTNEPCSMPAKPWVYHCKLSMLWEYYKSYTEYM